MEFDSSGNHIRSDGMGGVRELVRQLLPASRFEFPPEKVINSRLYFSPEFDSNQDYLFEMGFFFVNFWMVGFEHLCLDTSVVGLNFDFVLLNLTKHSSYLIYNATLYFSSTVQQQYFEKYGEKQVCSVFALPN